jgi:hypothetical protein
VKRFWFFKFLLLETPFMLQGNSFREEIEKQTGWQVEESGELPN